MVRDIDGLRVGSKCPHCKMNLLVLVPGNREPNNTTHLACPGCDSTYISKVMKIIKCECGCSNFVVDSTSYNRYYVDDGILRFLESGPIRDKGVIITCEGCHKDYKKSDFHVY